MKSTKIFPKKIITNENDNTEQLNKQNPNKVTVILHNVVLECKKNEKGKVILLNANDHHKEIATSLKKFEHWRANDSLTKDKQYFPKSAEEFRPDILHHSLLNLLDSPLNKNNMLQIFFITKSKSIYWVSPKTRLPRNQKNFAGLIIELLAKFKLQANEDGSSGEERRGGRILLMKCIKNLDEFTDFNDSINLSFTVDGIDVQFNELAAFIINQKAKAKDENKDDKGGKKDALTVGWDMDVDNSGEHKNKAFDKIALLLEKRAKNNKQKENVNVTVWISGVSKGEPEVDPKYPIDLNVKVSKFGLSAAYCCSKVTNAFEEQLIKND